MLYIKPVTDITWDDIEEFCKQETPEGVFLDYKQDFPKHLEKTIAAMANTLGGVILIGIAEDQESKPRLPIDGISFLKGLPERVMNIILTNIAPPVFPEITVCRNDDGLKAVIVIRIPQSHQSPHAVAGNKQVYLRTGNRNNPEELAQIDEIEWLSNSRCKSEMLRVEIFERAGQRFESFYEKKLKEWADKSQLIGKIEKGWLSLSFCPVYPKEILCTPPKMRSLIKKLTVSDYYGTHSEFPIFENIYGMLVQDAVIFSAYYHESVFHTELNCYGLFFNKQSLLKMGVFNGQEIPILRGGEIFCRLDEFIDSASKYYNELGYWGPLSFRVDLSDIRECPFNLPLWNDPRDELYYCPDSQVTYEDKLLSNVLLEEKPRIILEIIQRLGWAFNIDITLTFLRRFYRKIKGKDLFPEDFNG